MSVTNLIMDGITLMLVGMGIVFSFLILLVFTLKAMSRIAQIFEPEIPLSTFPAKPAVDNNMLNDSEIIAVISTAIRCYRQTETKRRPAKSISP